jgi:hypothetical protein
METEQQERAAIATLLTCNDAMQLMEWACQLRRTGRVQYRRWARMLERRAMLVVSFE